MNLIFLPRRIALALQGFAMIGGQAGQGADPIADRSDQVVEGVEITAMAGAIVRIRAARKQCRWLRACVDDRAETRTFRAAQKTVASEDVDPVAVDAADHRVALQPSAHARTDLCARRGGNAAIIHYVRHWGFLPQTAGA